MEAQEGMPVESMQRMLNCPLGQLLHLYILAGSEPDFRQSMLRNPVASYCWGTKFEGSLAQRQLRGDNFTLIATAGAGEEQGKEGRNLLIPDNWRRGG